MTLTSRKRRDARTPDQVEVAQSHVEIDDGGAVAPLRQPMEKARRGRLADPAFPDVTTMMRAQTRILPRCPGASERLDDQPAVCKTHLHRAASQCRVEVLADAVVAGDRDQLCPQVLAEDPRVDRCPSRQPGPATQAAVDVELPSAINSAPELTGARTTRSRLWYSAARTHRPVTSCR